MNNNILNLVLFQLGWFGCVLSGAAGQPLIGTALAMVIVSWHVWHAPKPQAELKLIAVAVLIGTVWDSFLVWQNWLSYPSGMVLPYTAPYWIVMLWALFATTLNMSLRWLKGRLFYAVVFGAVGGPLAYFAGQRLGAVEFSDINTAMLALFIGWAFITPLLMSLSQRYDGYSVQWART